MQKNGEYKGKVAALGSGGEGIIYSDGETVFVPLCLPDEEISFKVLSSKNGVSFGKVTEVHTVSRDRVAPVCPVFGKCGGCDLQHMSYSAQLEYKRGAVENCLKKIGGLSVAVNPAVASAEEYAYRNKLALPVGVNASGGAETGFYAPRSHRIVPNNGCPLQKRGANAAAEAMRAYLAAGAKPYDEATGKGDIRRLVVREIKGGYIVTVVSARRVDLTGFEKLLEEKLGNFTLLLNINSSRGNAIFGKEWHICRGKGFFEAEDSGIKYKAGAETFLQVNDGVRAKLYSSVVAAVGKNCAAIDLYSGGSMLTALLAKACGFACGVEIVEEAVRCADGIKDMNGLDGRMVNICGAVEDKIDEALALTEGKKRVIVCDPPRKGMGRSVVKAVLRSGAEKVVLISCNPATLARDAGLLCGSLKEEGGQLIKTPDGGAEGVYKIESVTPFDMFPQTVNVETLVLLSKKKPDSHIVVDVEFGEGEGKISLKDALKRAEGRKPKSKTTYKDIQNYVEENYGFKVHTAYIAEVKRNLGLPMYDAPNAVEELKRPRSHPTEKMVLAIKETLAHFEII